MAITYATYVPATHKAEFQNALVQSFGKNCVYRMVEYLGTSANARAIVALDNGVVIGGVGVQDISIQTKDPDDKIWAILIIGVNPNYTGQGVATELLRRVGLLAKQQNVTVMTIEATDGIKSILEAADFNKARLNNIVLYDGDKSDYNDNYLYVINLTNKTMVATGKLTYPQEFLVWE